MSGLIKVIMICFATVFLSAVLKKQHPEFAIAVVVVSSAVILSFLIGYFDIAFENITRMMEQSGINSDYTKTILKIISVAYLSEYSAALFYDSGDSAMAKKIELTGKVIIFIITIPVIEALANLIISFLGGG